MWQAPRRRGTAPRGGRVLESDRLSQERRETRLRPKQKQPKVRRGSANRLGETLHGRPLEKRQNTVPQSRTAGQLPSCSHPTTATAPFRPPPQLQAALTRPPRSRSPAPRPGSRKHARTHGLRGSPPVRPAFQYRSIRDPATGLPKRPATLFRPSRKINHQKEISSEKIGE